MNQLWRHVTLYSITVSILSRWMELVPRSIPLTAGSTSPSSVPIHYDTQCLQADYWQTTWINSCWDVTVLSAPIASASASMSTSQVSKLDRHETERESERNNLVVCWKIIVLSSHVSGQCITPSGGVVLFGLWSFLSKNDYHCWT